jgi:hypothetical protein
MVSTFRYKLNAGFFTSNNFLNSRVPEYSGRMNINGSQCKIKAMIGMIRKIESFL